MRTVTRLAGAVSTTTFGICQPIGVSDACPPRLDPEWVDEYLIYEGIEEQIL